MTSKWNYLPLTKEQEQIKESLQSDIGASSVICELLVRRGVKDKEEAQKFFSPQLSDLHDPYLMDGMREAVDRLNYAIGQKEGILIFGDYDVDGITSITVLKSFLKDNGLEVDFYIPNRLEEGYGLNKEAVKKIADSGCQLMITVDCRNFCS